MPQPFYPSDLTDAEWEKIAPWLPPEKALGNKRSVNFRDVINAIFYRADNGIKWRAMPADFPAWETVYGYYRKWVKQGIWELINRALLQEARQQAGRNEQPSLGLIDSQSVKQAQKGGKKLALMATKK
jgi:transposase